MALLNRATLRLINLRHFHSTPNVGFKFKLTEEMSRKFEENQKKLQEQIKEPVLASSTLNSTLLLARVSSDRYQKVVKVGVPKHRLNELLMMFIREQDSILAYDKDDLCKTGDWVLLRKQEEPLDKGVNHIVERVIYSYGNYIDPITKRRSLGIYYDDDMEELEEVKIEI